MKIAHASSKGHVAACAALCALALGVVTACPRDAAPTRLERPAPPLEGAAAARVLFVTGDVVVTPASGAPFAAAVGTDLVADDRIDPAAAAKIVVVLRNGHAVRIDDAGALAVREIVLFDAPETTRPVDEQLQALLDDGEALPLTDVRDRAAAWRQMLRAAETAGASKTDGTAAREVGASEAKLAAVESVPALAQVAAPAAENANRPAPPPSEAPPEAPSDLLGGLQDASGSPLVGVGLGGGGGGTGHGLGAGGLGGGATTRERTSAKEPEADEPKKRGGEDGKMGKRDAKDADANGAKDASAATPTQNAKGAAKESNAPERSGSALDGPVAPPPPPPVLQAPAGFGARFGASVSEAQPIDAPAPLVAMAAELGRCIAQSLPPAVALRTAELLVEVRGGVVKRVRLGGALPVPLCARSVAVENAARQAGADGWLVVTVPLTR